MVREDGANGAVQRYGAELQQARFNMVESMEEIEVRMELLKSRSRQRQTLLNHIDMLLNMDQEGAPPHDHHIIQQQFICPSVQVVHSQPISPLLRPAYCQPLAILQIMCPPVQVVHSHPTPPLLKSA